MLNHKIGNLNLIKILLVLAVLMSTSIFLAGCTDGETVEEDGSENGIIVTDQAQNEVKFDSHPETVVTLMPHLTETLYALDMEDKIVGVSDFCNYPEEVMDKSQVGDAFDLNVEKIASLEPDVLLMGEGEMMGDMIEQFEEMDIETLVFDPKTLDEIEEMYVTIGELFDDIEAAESLAAELQEDREKLEKSIDELDEHPTGVMLLEPESLFTVGADEFMTEVIELTGIDNIAAEESGYYEISQEILLEEDPDLIITTYHDLEDIEQMGALSELTAVQEGDVYQAHEDKFSRPGPRIIDGAREVMQDIHE